MMGLKGGEKYMDISEMVWWILAILGGFGGIATIYFIYERVKVYIKARRKMTNRIFTLVKEIEEMLVNKKGRR